MAYETLRLNTEVRRCLLCHEAPCTKACPKHLQPSRVIRSLRFANQAGAGMLASDACGDCGAPCKAHCNRAKIDRAIDIPGIMRDMRALRADSPDQGGPVDLSVDFCGVRCENPFFLSSSVVGSNYEMVAKAFAMGWAGVAFKTVALFVPQEASPRFAVLDQSDGSFAGLKNIEQLSEHTLEENIAWLKRLKQEYPSKVIIASIMGRDEAEWTLLSRRMEEAGADMIECNFSCPHMSGEGLGSDIGTHPELVEQFTAATRRGTKLPILAKMTPNITNMQPPALAAVRAGADGITAINTIKSIMNVDLHTFTSAPDVGGKSAVGGYSGKAVRPIALRFVHELKSEAQLAGVPLSGAGGIETWRDAAEFIALGCGTVQVTTAVMEYGYRIIEDMLEGLSTYLRAEGMRSVSGLAGRALAHVLAAEALDRHTVEYPKFDRKTCVSCGRCYLSCYDGGHQAIRMDETTGQPVLDAAKCVGCQLCRLVCPAGAITRGARVEADTIQPLKGSHK